MPSKFLPSKSSPSAIDLFAGAGGLSLGLHEAGWGVTTAIELDRWAVATYQHNFPQTQVLDGDIRSIDFRQFQGIDLITGGPPCQPFSVAGKQLARDDERDLVPECIRAVREAQPKAFVMENVPGLQTAKHQSYRNCIVEQLHLLGYSIYLNLLNAADYGVPQYRERLFIVGIPPGTTFAFPPKTHGSNAQFPHVASGRVLSEIPPDEPNTAKVSYAKKPVLRPSPWAGMLVNGGGRPINLNQPSPTIPATAGGNRTHIFDPDGVLRNYHRDLMAGGQPRQGRVTGVRRLTVRESARLQSFPEDFTFIGPKTARYRQVGNAVPPKLGKAIATALFQALFSPEQLQGDKIQLELALEYRTSATCS